MIGSGITSYHFCKKTARLRGVICWAKGVIMRNWATHFQFRSRFFRHGSQTMGAHNATQRILMNLTLGPWIPLSLVWVFLSQLCPPYSGDLLIHWHVMQLFNHSLGASSRHQQLYHRNHNLEQIYLDMIQG